MYSDNYLFSKIDCARFCKDTLIAQGDKYDWGWQFCCDYEDWADGTFNCHLSEGFRATPQNTTEYPVEVFSHFVFHYGEHLLAYDEEEASIVNSVSALLLASTAVLFSI